MSLCVCINACMGIHMYACACDPCLLHFTANILGVFEEIWLPS